jgi:hypothetical protein
MASPRLARHAGLRHGGDPSSRERHAAPKNEAQSQIDDAPDERIPIRWSIQEIRRIAGRFAQSRIEPALVIAWSAWRRAHQAEAKRAHLKKMQL